MSASKRLLSLNTIERLVFRPLFVFLTFSVVLLAIFQASGRFAMYTLSLFEDEVNTVLAAQGIAVRGVSGDWRGLNPVVRIDSVTFPAGSIVHLEAELDVLESMFRSSLVPKRLSLELADVFLDQSAQGWRLRGQTQQAQFDATDMLRHGDLLEGLVHIHFVGHDDVADVVEAQLSLINHDSTHFGEFVLRNTKHLDDSLQGQIWQRNALGIFSADLNAMNLVGSILLPSALTGFSNLKLLVPDAQWLDIAGQGGGFLNAMLEEISLPGSDDLMGVQLEIIAQRDSTRIGIKAKKLVLAVGQDSLELAPIYFNARAPAVDPLKLKQASSLLIDQPTPPAWKMWLAELDLSESTRFFNTHFYGLEPAAAWVKALALQGRAHNVHLFYDDEQGMGYEGFISGLSVQGYKGVPTVRDIEARLWGYDLGAAVQVKGQATYLQFPGLFHEGWPLTDVQGVVKGWFRDGYLALQGTHIKARLGDTSVVGAFAITRPKEVSEQRLSLQIGVDEVALLQAKSFVPFNLPEAFANWLVRGPRGGMMHNAHYASHGQVRQRPGELGRRIELVSQISQGIVEYHPDWPIVSNLDAQIHVAGLETKIAIASGRSQGLTVRDSKVVLHNNASYATGEIDVSGDAQAMLGFVAASPLMESLAFITPQWRASGDMLLAGDLVIPIRAEASPDLSVDLKFKLGGVALEMPNYRLQMRDLAGPGTFSLPHHLAGKFAGLLFEQPATITAHSNDAWLIFDITGTATPGNVYDLLDTRQAIPAQGEFEFDSVLNLAMQGGITNMSMTSGLAGLQVDLPASFAKSEFDVVTAEVDVQFLSDYQSVRWQYQKVNGWLHYGDGIERGAVGISAAPPMTSQDERAIVISGHMPTLQLRDWVGGDGESAVNLPLDWKIRNLQVDEFFVEEFVFNNFKLDGEQSGSEVFFEFDGPELRGHIALPGDDVLSMDLAYIKLPDPYEGADEHIGQPQIDPMSIQEGRSLPSGHVNIEQIDLGDEPFGAWSFDILTTDDLVELQDFTVDVNGIHIENGNLKWDLRGNRTAFDGSIRLDNLGETLPKWDYAASLTTTKAVAKASVNWSGSPLNVGLLAAKGDLTFSARDGRFIEVEAGGGGLRILSLLNFSKAAKRINLDFSDVGGEGLSFDKIDGTFALNEGEMTFPKRLEIESSSGRYQVGGKVDLRSGELDNEMIVTLPVSKSLPWYGVYLALANPLIGVGVVVGELVLRKPIERFSTAKFKISGTFDDPKVKFVSLWDQQLKVVKPTKDGEPTSEQVLR